MNVRQESRVPQFAQLHALLYLHRFQENVERAVQAMTLYPASVRIGITLLHTEPSLHDPWTKTILVLFSGSEPNVSDGIEVSFCGLANPVYLIEAKLVISRTPKHTKTTDSVCLKTSVIS